MAKKPRQPFEVVLSDEKRDELALELSRALDDALSVRSATEMDVAYWHTLYEQGRTRNAKNSPWADAADFTSCLGTQYVDVMRSSIVKTVMVDPVYTVEGYGQSEAKAPFVEEFHQWQIEAEGFQQCFSRAVHLSLIEPWGILEVYEDTIKRPVRRVIKVATQQAPDGTTLLDEKFQPVLQQKPDGTYVEALDELTPSAEMVIDSFETVCRGPRHRTIAYRDYLQLPAHATDKSEVWGHAKRFYRRLDQLKERAKAGLYDPQMVEDLGGDDERASETTLAGEPIGVASKDGSERVEKELWEVLFLGSMDGKGLRWYVATLHKDKHKLLRLQYDDIGRPRYFPFVPFPRPNSTEGYSYIGHKLITTIEEDTAWRNYLADVAARQLQAPMYKLAGETWDPDSEPIGPRAVLTLRSREGVGAIQIPDQTAPAVERIRDCERRGERLSGINDASAGITSQDQRTLGEIQLITEQSQGRVSEAVKNIQETLEEIAQVRHLIWIRALKDMGAEGLEAPPSVAQSITMRTQKLPTAPLTPDVGVLGGLEERAPDVSAATPNVRFTVSMMEGSFRFKPRGSVENADKNRQRYDWGQWLQSMAQLSGANPMIAAVMQTPMAAKALIEQSIRLHSVPDKQAFLGSEAMAAMQQAMMMQQAQQMMGAAPPGGPGGAPGGPPAPVGPPQ